jgi:phosphate starvation-inducible PhoH-like protein
LSQSEIILTVENVDPVALFGENNNKLNLIRKTYPDATITSRGTLIKITGKKKDTQSVKEKVELMVKVLREKKELSFQTVEGLLLGDNPYQTQPSPNESKMVLVHGRDGKTIYAKTKNQQLLVDASHTNDVVFAIGPAGTGKTYTAVAIAVRALKNKEVRKIILTRPAVEAGESLGFLPGDLKEKIDPYLRPLYDALDDMIPADKLHHFMETRVIEIAPLAFMRGRTLDNAFIILDEAQNCTPLQLKMFLTRLGPSAKAIITGDLSQIDLPYNQSSGLRHATKLLQNIFGITTIYLSREDVVRHRLVKDILKAYEDMDNAKMKKNDEDE